MPYVHDPSALISGGLTDGTASGTINVYGTGSTETSYPTSSPVSLGDPNGNKVNSASYASPEYKVWGDADANLLGHLIMDVVNSGTVPLFATATLHQATADSLQAWVSGSGARFDSASSSFSATQVLFTAASQSIFGAVSGWSGSGDYPGPFAADYSSSVTSVSGVLMYALFKASGALGTALGMQTDMIDLQSSSSEYSASLYGNGSPGYTGALAQWISGAMQALIDLSASFYGAFAPGELVLSQSMIVVAKTLLGVTDLSLIVSGTGPWTGSFPTATFNDLRLDFYGLSGAFWPLSTSFYPLSASYSGNLIMTTALSAAFNSSASKWDSASSSFSATQVSYAGLSSALNSSASVWNAVSSAFWPLSSALDSSASIWNANTTGALSGAFYALSGNLNTSASRWNAVSSSFSALSGNLDSSASVWNAVAAAQAGMAYLTSSNWQPDGGLFNITGTAVNISGSPVSSSHQFGNGAVNVQGGYDGLHVEVINVSGANFIELWGAGGQLLMYWDGFGQLWSTASIYTEGIVRASGGFDAGFSKIVNVFTGSVSGDAVNYDQFQPVSSTLVVVSQSAASSTVNFLLANDPVTSGQYTASYSGGLVSSEVWKTLAGATLVKSSSYAYSASLLTQSLVSIFAANGSTIIGQTTSSYFYSGTALVSATVSRSI